MSNTPTGSNKLREAVEAPPIVITMTPANARKTQPFSPVPWCGRDQSDPVLVLRLVLRAKLARSPKCVSQLGGIVN